MMEYKALYWHFISYHVKRSLKKRFTSEQVKNITKRAGKANRELLRLADDIGADNPMASNLYGAIAFLAFHAGNPAVIRKEELAVIIDEFYQNRVVVFLMKRWNLNDPAQFKKFRKRMEYNDSWIKKRREQYPSSWDFNFETDHKDGLYYQFTKCPLAAFFKKNGYEQLTPLFCAMDYKTLSLLHADLYRDHTIAEGAGVCDFWIVPDNIKHPK